MSKLSPPTIRRRHADISSALQNAALPEVLKRVYAGRGITDPGELALGLDQLLPPTSLKGVADAAELLADAIEGEARVLIVGDFDADGATSCAMAVSVLQQMGLREVAYLVPNRFEFGYGLTPEIVEMAAAQMPDLIVTVDNGISSVEGVSAAQAMGISVLVTDHHLPGDSLPTADVIVNPNQPGCQFPSKSLAGVGVMFYVLSAVRAALRERGWFNAESMEEPNLADSLDLVALGTVADVVPTIVEAAIAAGADTSVRACGQDYIDELEALATEIRATLSAIPDDARYLVTNHDAFGYFAARYDFEVVGTVIPSLSSLAETNPADLADLAAIIEELDIPAIFAEYQAADTEANALAEVLPGVSVATLDSGSLRDSNDSYMTFMRRNTQVIAEALG